MHTRMHCHGVAACSHSISRLMAIPDGTRPVAQAAALVFVPAAAGVEPPKGPPQGLPPEELELYYERKLTKLRTSNERVRGSPLTLPADLSPVLSVPAHSP